MRRAANVPIVLASEPSPEEEQPRAQGLSKAPTGESKCSLWAGERHREDRIVSRLSERCYSLSLVCSLVLTHECEVADIYNERA